MPIVALLTDFGLSDVYVGVMKGVLLSHCPQLVLVDITHAVPPQDVAAGALQLEAAWPWFPPGTVFLCVVDPGVGSSRRALVVRSADRLFVGPDNGLLSWLPEPEVYEIERPDLPLRSRTFHGRDLFAPVAGELAAGVPVAKMGRRVYDPVSLSRPESSGDTGEVLAIDHYGNLITSLAGRDDGVVEVAGRTIPVRRVYTDVAPGAVVVVTGSTGRLEVSVRNGNAAAALGLGRGTAVRWRSDG